jgi:hexosaminidase
MARSTDLHLVPAPKKLSFREGTFNPRGKRYIKLEAEEPRSLITAAKKAGFPWEITASPKAPKDQVGLTIRLDETSGIPAEGYKLDIRPDGILITASMPAGAFYGACTLRQIANIQHPTSNFQLPTNTQHRTPNALPCLSIVDSPDFPARGVMLDISRDKVPTMEMLYGLVDLLASWKINQFQLYTEHTFRYLAHPIVWEKADPMTGEQIMALDAYCRERFIELVPNQNSFGHMERWLKHDEYRAMAEAPNGCDTAWGHFDYPFSLSPIDKRSLPFVASLFEELLPHFTSRMFNVGLDETVDLGCGRSKKICQERGTGRVYLDFLLRIYDYVKKHGHTMQFWGDIIVKHPELIHELPPDIIALEWGYEADHPFRERGEKFRESGIEFYLCPGTSSWNTLSGRAENAIGNITSAAKNGLELGAIGLLNTDWGDSGHWQPLSVSYLGFMVGAMASWNAKADVRTGLAESLSINAFGDPTGKLGQAFFDLGEIYRIFKKKTFNASVQWQMLFRENNGEGLELREFETMDLRLDGIADEMKGDKASSADAGIVREEIKHLIKLLKLASDVGKSKVGGPKPRNLKARVEGIKESHRHVWLLRNRPGGLEDSVGKIKV